MPAPKRSVPLTASDVQAAAAAGARELSVPSAALVTPLARDVARELGVTLVDAPGHGGAAPSSDDLTASVRRIVAGLLGGAGGDRVAPARVRHVDSRDVRFEPFPFEGPGEDMDVRVADVVTTEHGATMGAGFLTLTKGCFPWTLTYDEVELVLEGELHLGTDDGVLVGRPGDVLYVPEGSRITFGTPSWVRLLYVTYPADWAGQP
jgi:ethanolamine utilization protein EutQ